MGGISLLLIPRNLPGVGVRKLETQFDNSHSTTFVTFDDVRVPVKNLIGEENMGFQLIMVNFNHERFVISAGVCVVHQNINQFCQLKFEYFLTARIMLCLLDVCCQYHHFLDTTNLTESQQRLPVLV